MEIAKLILEFLKVLTWPLVTLVIVWQFRPHLERILKQFGDRLKTAETLKVGVMGQEVQLSGTARELVKERDLLVQTGKLDESTQQALAIDAATRELNNPMADLVGMILLAASEAMPLEEITRRLIKTMSPNEAPNQQTPFMVVMMSKEIEKMLMSLQSLAYIQCHDDVYALSQSGREFFQRVQERYGLFMAKFQALGQLRQGERSGG
jgi:signal transduction histidine kinase